MRNMYLVVLDESQSMRVKSRAANNLKQIGLALHNYHDVESVMSSNTQNPRQQEMLRALKSEVQEAERQWQAQQSRPTSRHSGGAEVLMSDGSVSFRTDASLGAILSNKDVQRELVAGNRA